MKIDEKTLDIISTIVGSFDIIDDHRADNERTGVISINVNNQKFFVKIHKNLWHWHPEVFAYKSWTKFVEPFAPIMRSSFNNGETFGIITTPIKGRTVNETNITEKSRLIEIYYNAGKHLRKMQNGANNSFFGIPKVDGTPLEHPYLKTGITDPVEYITLEIESIFKLGYDKNIFTNKHMPLVNYSLKSCEIFGSDKPVFTNKDFSQNNWMVDENGIFTGFIDFEKTHWGLSLDSFGVVIERYAFDKPDLRQALFDGYGLPDDETTKLKIQILNVKMALTDIYNGLNNNHPHFVDCGQRMLNQLIAEFK